MLNILKIIFFIKLFRDISADTYSVKINTDHHVNVIDNRFLSFTIDPKYLFSSNENFNKECMCMASSLTPAYLRIAGPSTSALTFENTTITLEDTFQDQKPVKFKDIFTENFPKIDEVFKRRGIFDRFKRNNRNFEVSHGKWKGFVKWAKRNGFDLVFALNYDEKMDNGLWDPNTALDILTVADKDTIHDMFWQLGYECKNQSIEEYLNDLETLRVITDTFPSPHKWKVVGGDVTGCLQQDSKSDFKDYVTLSCDMLDAVMLDGNSSTYELERLKEKDRYKLLKVLSESTTPLWLSEKASSEELGELSRAADWLTSLGHAARNGFSIHFRELNEVEMYQPTLSFYMALLYKNLVGDKVLQVDMEPDQAVLFAHCTSLRHKKVPGAVTLYGANMDDEPARLSIKLSQKEEGGDIMQFVLGHDSNGNIIVNGKPMYFEGDIKPVVKRVRPYRTLLINLPPKSFGFWVLANTKVSACFDDSDKLNDKIKYNHKKAHTNEKNKIKLEDNSEFYTKYSDEDESYEDIRVKSKRSLDFELENDTSELKNENLITSISNINEDLHKVKETFKDTRVKRDIEDQAQHIRRKFKKIKQKLFKNVDNTPKDIVGNILNFAKRNLTRPFKNDRLRKTLRLNRNKLYKRQPKKDNKGEINEDSLSRRRRSADEVNLSNENEINIEDKDNARLWSMLRKIHKQLKELPDETSELSDDTVEISEIIDNSDQISEITDTSEDVETDDVKNESNFIKNTVDNLLKVLVDLNKNLNKVWKAIDVLE